MHDPRDLTEINQLNDSEMNDESANGFEIEAVKPRAVVASQSDF